MTGSDRTLSSAHWVESAGFAIVTAYDSKRYCLFHTAESHWNVGSKTFSSRFQDSAVSTSGRYAVFVNAAGRLYRVNLRDRAGHTRDPVSMCQQALPRSSAITKSSEFIALTMPEDSLVHAFWIERGEMWLATVRGDVGALCTIAVQLDGDGL